MLVNADCLEYLKDQPSNIFDSLVTDPPAGISFMGKEWDHHKGGRDEWIRWLTFVMLEVKRVLKPGAHGFVWALPRTSHWTATALENAGFEIRDVVTHLFGSGFPKSLDISKAIDKAAGAEREVISECGSDGVKRKPRAMAPGYAERQSVQTMTAPATEDAKKWEGWGTALKPASEHWILIRKPLAEKTVAANVIEWGTGGINIDASRIGNEKRQGRFPANLILDEEAGAMLDEQSGVLKNGGQNATSIKGFQDKYVGGKAAKDAPATTFSGDSGGASRFFYCAKTSKAERNAGCEELPLGAAPGSKRSTPAEGRSGALGEPRANHHPTVKPQKLMQYLIKMVTPEGGIVLDPFMGSGSTGVAAKALGFGFVGVEREAEYHAIAQARINA